MEDFFMCSKEEKPFFRKINDPAGVRMEKCAAGAASLIGGSGSMTIFSGGYVIFDMGSESVGGYPVFVVSDYAGQPAIHISYSDRFTPYEKEDTAYYGDFLRGSCTYLGVELPVMPANPDRYEDYTIRRRGVYLYPLIQGQERFVMISVPAVYAGSVTLSRFYLADDSDEAVPAGYFHSDEARLDSVWLASARTVRLATIHADQFAEVCGKICLRKLTQYQGEVLFRNGNFFDIRMRCDFAISRNPAFESGLSVLLFADGEKAYRMDIRLQGSISLFYIKDGQPNLLRRVQTLPFTDNMIYCCEITGNRSEIKIRIEKRELLSYTGEIVTGGSFGFSMESEWRALIDCLEVMSDGACVYGKNCGLDLFQMRKTGFFISDGAKRDRLPWTGDLDWAFQCGWYAFGGDLKAMNTLNILAFHTNPEGFIFGVCYPENTMRPGEKEYGCYQSDMFSAWFVVSALTYEQLSGDDRVRRLFPVMRGCMEYLWKYVDQEDGLFDQRYETSKGLWDHTLGDTGKNTYTNLLICDAFQGLAHYAQKIGETACAEECAKRGEYMQRGIFTHLYDEALGGFIKRKDWRVLCDMANPYAMGKGMVTDPMAAKIAAQAQNLTHAYGKIAVLMINGLYRYGFPEKAEALLFGKLPLYAGDSVFSYVDWMSVIDAPDLPETVYECMHNPPPDFGDNLNWGDLSHPDSGVCGVISGRIAGILPAAAGFRSIFVKPHPGGCKKIDCRVPAADGCIDIRIRVCLDHSSVELTVPRGTVVETDFSELVQPVRFTFTERA